MGGGEKGDQFVAAGLSAIADSSALIAFAQIGLLDDLEELFAECLVPPAVAHEIKPTIPVRPLWIIELPLQGPLDPQVVAAQLGPGETEAISLALELRSYGLLLDDRRGRRLAESLGLAVAGTVRILIEAKTIGIIPVVRPSLMALLDANFFVSTEVIRAALEEAGE